MCDLYVRSVVFFPAAASVPKPRVARRCVCETVPDHGAVAATQNATAVEKSAIAFQSPMLNEKIVTASTQEEVISWVKQMSNPQRNALFCAQFHPWNNSWLVNCVETLHRSKIKRDFFDCSNVRPSTLCVFWHLVRQPAARLVLLSAPTSVTLCAAKHSNLPLVPRLLLPRLSKRPRCSQRLAHVPSARATQLPFAVCR